MNLVNNARHGHRYTLNLRAHQSYTRFWVPLDHGHLNGTNKSPDYFRPLPNGKEPDGQETICNLRSNGEWVFEPDLTARDCEQLFYDASGIEWTRSSPRLRGIQAGVTHSVIFQISAANIITSMRLEAEGICAHSSDLLKISVSRHAGIRWQEVWTSTNSGPQNIRLQLRDEVGGTPFCWVKVEMLAAKNTADVGLNSLKVTTTTLVNRLTLPALTLGSNIVQLHADEPAETVELWPFLHDNLHKETVFAEDNVFSAKEPDGMYKATLGSGVNHKACSATWRVQAPSDILDISYTVIATSHGDKQWVSLQHSWEGEHFTEFHRHQDDGFPLDRRIERVFRGTEVPKSARQACFRAVFFTPSGAGTYTMAGIQDLLIRIHHRSRTETFKPFEVTYNWTEHRQAGDVTRSHTERVTQLPWRYTVNVAGKRDPSMNWVRLNLCGFSPERKARRYGYSDGVNVGPGCEPRKVIYRWGKNRALGAPYTTSRPSSVDSKNPDSGGRELTNGKIIAPTGDVVDQSVQAATAFWEFGEPVTFVVDLGSNQPVAAVRVSTHQPNARFCHPKHVTVAVSSDAQNWKEAGMIQHDDLWNPPGDYEPWEYDQGWKYSSLPSGGRLAYSFPLVFKDQASARYVRFTCTPLEGKGFGLSELQVFDNIEVKPWPAEIWLPEVVVTKR
jgi:hypothetical protein